MVNMLSAEVNLAYSASFFSSIDLYPGDDGKVRVWEVATLKCVQTLQHPIEKWGQITCLLWVSSAPPIVPSEKTFVYIGGGRGSIGLAALRDSAVRVPFLKRFRTTLNSVLASRS